MTSSIFYPFHSSDIVAGFTNQIDSGFWPGATTFWSQSSFISNFFALTQSLATPSPSIGTSNYDIRQTMYFVNVYPDSTHFLNNDAYFSVAYGNYYSEISGSGDFNLDTGSIFAFAPKAIYTQYQNMLLGSSEQSSLFQFLSGSSNNPAVITGNDIFVISFSSYKMKDKVDQGLFEITLTGSKGAITVCDDSPFITQTQNVYNLISGSIGNLTTLPPYQGIGLFYPEDGVAIFNAQVVDQLVGLSTLSQSLQGPVSPCPAAYTTNSIDGIVIPGLNNTSWYSSGLIPTTVNHQVFFWAIQNANNTFKVRKSEYVPSQHYFIRVKNLDFNYSNNPTYVYNGSDGIHSAGTIYNQNFITNPTTYPTTVGLYNSNNQLVAVGKLSRPAVKNFTNELLIKVALSF